MTEDFETLRRRALATNDPQDWQRVHAVAERLGLGIDGEPLPAGAFRQVQVPGLPLTEICDGRYWEGDVNSHCLTRDGRFVVTVFSETIDRYKYLDWSGAYWRARIVDISRSAVVWERAVSRDCYVFFDDANRLLFYNDGRLFCYSGDSWSEREALFSGQPLTCKLREYIDSVKSIWCLNYDEIWIDVFEE